jgi:hypothetical protein
VLYNLIFVIGRSVFWALDNLFPVGWYVMDYTCDVIYLTDLFIRMHEGMKHCKNLFVRMHEGIKHCKDLLIQMHKGIFTHKKVYYVDCTKVLLLHIEKAYSLEWTKKLISAKMYSFKCEKALNTVQTYSFKCKKVFNIVKIHFIGIEHY